MTEAFRIVGIGASAGGVEALQTLFRGMSEPPPSMAFVVVTHLARGHHSALPAIIGDCTTMTVQAAVDGQELRPGQVHVLDHNAVLTLAGGKLVLREQAASRPRERYPIDVFLASLAEDQSQEAIGIVLSGSGHDGTLGLKTIREAGGLTIAQGPDTDVPAGTAPQYPEMPDSAVSAGVVDLVVPAGQMGARLRALSAGPADLAEGGRSRAALAALHAEIAAILLATVGHDFSGYKDKTFFRRVQRRLHVLGLPNAEAYLARLRAEPEEARLLFRDLLIGVTGFFRDAEAFAALESHAIPSLFRDRTAEDVVRVWVPGCATGEEAYSIAILLREYMAAHPGGPRAQIFATDIDEAALAVARRGRYPRQMLSGVSAPRLARFFTEDAASFAVTKELRDTCVFSPHSVINDPPFSRIDLVSCRNLLIYLGGALQDQVIPLFHYALRPRGLLFLGVAETIARHTELFAPDDKAHRLYRRREGGAPPTSPPYLNAARTWPLRPPARPPALGRGAQLRQMAEATVLDCFAPPHVVVSRDGDVLHQSAHLGRYLEPAAGRPSRQLLAMARPGLRVALRAALREAAETAQPVVRPMVEMEGDGRRLAVTLTVTPLPAQPAAPAPPGQEAPPAAERDVQERLFLVLFSEVLPAPIEAVAGGPEGGGAARLERELRDTRERLQSTTEEYETATEELTSANEEMVSVNEELQSTNEELETSKEELQSVNEELRTANTELSGKIDELDLANADLRNLFDSTQIATLFLDRHLVIRSFTPAVSSIFNLVPSDRGRPVTDFASQLDQVDLRMETRRALTEREAVERRVTARDGTVHYLMRMLPYRTAEGEVDGVVLTFFDVTKVVEGEMLGTLVDELNHRVRNMLQVVQAVATSTLRRAKSLPEFGEAFGGRIKALARAHELLSEQGWSTVDLRALIAKEVEPYADGPDRVEMQGEPVRLPPKFALALGMVLHEIATNAAKHGALGVPGGRVQVGWRHEGSRARARLLIHWSEIGGPVRLGPPSRGFGSDLIERLLRHDLGGSSEVAQKGDRRVMTLRIPLDMIAPARRPNTERVADRE
ncbi:CheR family methyltransferase [Falsiroseomonas sp. HC035]|uniref:CheR family methyltransferase n=1 Tax=Falsiroseomonas sp. HC035 TaxID=3390999 RepID=UPI003D31D461